MPRLSETQLLKISQETLADYRQRAESFWESTQDHDVSQNVEALLEALTVAPPARILDLGCGPGRDLAVFRAQGHEAVGLGRRGELQPLEEKGLQLLLFWL